MSDDDVDLSAVVRFDEIVKEMRDVCTLYDEATARAHAVLKDLGAAVREARDEVHRSSRDAVRRHLAKESEKIAQRIREEIKGR